MSFPAVPEELTLRGQSELLPSLAGHWAWKGQDVVDRVDVDGVHEDIEDGGWCVCCEREYLQPGWVLLGRRCGT